MMKVSLWNVYQLCSTDCFGELRHKTYHDKNLNFNLKKISSSKWKHKTTYQTSIFIVSSLFSFIIYCWIQIECSWISYIEDDNENLIHLIISGNQIPDNFPLLCNCLKYAKVNVNIKKRIFQGQLKKNSKMFLMTIAKNNNNNNFQNT